MRDGIISENMKSRLIKAGLPATYEELVALAADTGIPADILFNEEGWQQLPTYLSKANMLSDETEIAIWENAKNRTVNDALQMLADVAYGRVASLTLTINDTAGNPIPDVTVRLDSAPTVGEDPITGIDGKIKLDTNAGEHTAYLVYPLGYSVENAQKIVQVTGNTAITIANAARKAVSTVFTVAGAKVFYIARYLSPIQVDIRGGGGSGCALSFNYSEPSSKIERYAQGGAGGYVNIIQLIDVAGKLIRVYPGAGGNGVKAAAMTSSNSYRYTSGNRGGTTTIVIGDESFTAIGGAGGTSSILRNTDGGAAGGGGEWYMPDDTNNIEGVNGPNLFGDSSTSQKGSGGGGVVMVCYRNDESPDTYYGVPGKGGGTRGNSTDNAESASGSGAFAAPGSSGDVITGKGGPGFVAFRKAV